MDNRTPPTDYRTWLLLAAALVPTVGVAAGSAYIWTTRAQQIMQAESSIAQFTGQGFGEPPERLEQALMTAVDIANNQVVASTNAHVATLERVQTLALGTGLLSTLIGFAFFRMTINRLKQRRRTDLIHGYAAALLADQAQRDAETGVLNRRGLETWLPELLASTTSSDDHVILACLNLESLKSINDVWGHTVGDEVLRTVSERLDGFVFDDVRFELCRYGSDDFVLFAQTTERSTTWMEEAGQSMIHAAGGEVRLEGRVHNVGLSAGIATSTPTSTMDTLVLEADSALIVAKRTRGRAIVYDRQVSRTGELVHALPHALDEEFSAHIQPVIDVRDDQIVHVEALARWNRASGEQVPPSVFVPLAESYGLAEQLTQSVLRSVEGVLKHSATPDGLRVWINVSPHELDVNDFGTRFLALLHSIGVKPGQIGLEITETAAIQDPERLGEELRVLRSFGVGLAIDDFGNGYTPLGYLRMLPVDTVKLDRTLISNIDTDIANQHMVAGIVGLVHELGMTITAEGVEREEEKQWLQDHGVFHMQGYLFGHPNQPELVNWHRFEDFLEDAATSTGIAT